MGAILQQQGRPLQAAACYERALVLQPDDQVSRFMLAAVTGKEPRAPLDAVRMAKKKMWADSGKAARELGYSARPAVEALRRAAEWFKANGYCEDMAIGRRRTA